VSLPPPKERASLITLLADLQRAVEDLLLTGLAAASDGTRETLSTSFQAASRMKLLRLGFTLRVATEEIGRFARNDPSFSRRRYGFFLSRAWMLSRGLRQALEKDDAEHWTRLVGHSESTDLEASDVVSLGVGKRVVPGAFVAFDFRLRRLDDGRPLAWSSIFPLKPGVDVPPEAFLHLPQPQGFKAAAFLPGRVARVSGARVSEEGRLALTKEAKVEEAKDPFEDWDRVLTWDPRRALERVRAHRPGPFDLEVELQEEIVLRDFRAGAPEEIPRERHLRYPIETKSGLELHVVAGSGPEEKRLRETVGKWKRWQKGPLFGVVHYEMCRFVLQPLTLFQEKEPESVHVEAGSYDAAGLVKALNFK
jgi:hypothetical protein